MKAFAFQRGVLVSLAILAGVGSSCGEPTEVESHPAHLIVPGDYKLARPAPGHQIHLGIGWSPDGGRVFDADAGTLKQVLCRDCHALTDAGFESPSSKPCERCHETQNKQHHPFDGGTEFTCLTCHPFMAKTLPARFDRWPCFDCHSKPQADHPAITVHKAECQACHRPHQEKFTQPAECSQCHEVTLTHGKKGESMAERCMDCHPHHTEAAVASKQCIGCHTKDELPIKARVSPEALFKPGHTGCGSCHVPHRFQAGQVKACETCHRGQPVLARWEHDCTDCHRPHAPKARPIGCTDGCHKDEKLELKHPKSKDGKTCLGCHPVHAPSVADTLAKPCIACHDKEPFTDKVVHGAPILCNDCHDPHDAKPQTPRECKSCHSYRYTEVALMAARKPGTKVSGHSMCVDCHRQLPHGAPTPPKPCLECHEKQKPLVAKHDECTKCHQPHSGELQKACTSCHKPAELPALHAVPEHQTCQKCHSVHTATPAAPKGNTSPATCKACHPILSVKEHPTPPKECIGCHLFEPVKP